MRNGNPPIEVRLDPQRRARWNAAAERHGLTLSAFVRGRVDAAIAMLDPDLCDEFPDAARKAAR